MQPLDNMSLYIGCSLDGEALALLGDADRHKPCGVACVPDYLSMVCSALMCATR
jgi:hypothetical protein